MAEVLPVRMVEKPWGRDALPPPFVAPAGQKIGEIWFEPPAELPELLVKYIFTSEALSVQVHPSDTQTEAAGLGRQGKEECWLIVAAEPGARIGIGFDRPIGADAMRSAAEDGSIERLMTWFPVAAGDFFYIPANTVHAIGAGVSLIEIQQNSDITYRLYDYGRPRELHLREGMAVARGEPYAAQWHRHVPASGNIALVQGPFFTLHRLDGGRLPAGDGPALAIPLSGELDVAGSGLRVGQCACIADSAELTIPAGAQLLLARPLPSANRNAGSDRPGQATA